MAKNYSEKLKDPRWQKKRLEIMERDHFACSWCCDEGKTLNVHHFYYTRGKDIWDYPDSNFITLCEKCHERIHDYQSQINIALSEIHIWNYEQLIEILQRLKRFDFERFSNIFEIIKHSFSLMNLDSIDEEDFDF